ncbi:hypothetical protein JB92DRAFT_2976692 [Gautieria morchelliformis]|nr:hypothetical protein JB92DRAFT_2976692 [Gautieria morchelliformis]
MLACFGMASLVSASVSARLLPCLGPGVVQCGLFPRAMVSPSTTSRSSPCRMSRTDARLKAYAAGVSAPFKQ